MNNVQALGRALEELLRDEPVDREQLGPWYARAQSVSEQIRADVQLCKKVPEGVWHYLSDADIRLKDERYAKTQREELAGLIATLMSG